LICNLNHFLPYDILAGHYFEHTRINMHPLVNIALSAARQAGDIIVRNMEQLDRIKITAKSHNDYFSEVDVKAEQAIINTILKAYPDHGIVAEESGARNEDAEVVWIIDPLDGTNNFLHSFPFFAVSIAVRVKNRIEHGVVLDPLRHEAFTASRGQGARLNDRRLRVSKQTQLSTALLGTGSPVRNEQIAKRTLPIFESLAGKCSGVRRTGAAALDLAYVASGRLDGFWDLGLKPWDIAAGILLILEAGGLVSDPEGGEKYYQHGEIVAGNPKIFKALLQVLQPLLKKPS
jgi:myo-inositol-1(or 4)-monophosphatase